MLLKFKSFLLGSGFLDKGYIQVYTGDGKGKTTAALGLGLRAVGNGLRVLMIQFLKGWSTGELAAIKGLEPNFKIIRFAETEKFIFQMSKDEKTTLKEKINDELKWLYKELDTNPCDLLILDEILGCIDTGLVDIRTLLDLINKKPGRMEIVLTGRNAPKDIIDRADLVTEMKPIKHYMDKGVAARRGIEY